MLENDIKRIIFSQEEIDKRTEELAQEIITDYEGQVPLLIGLLKGSIPFMADLVKRMDLQLEMDFMDVSSYHGGTESTGEVTIIRDLNTDVKGREVLIVEDIVDSGRTLKLVVGLLKERGASSVKIVTLLDKREGRVVTIDADYVGFICPNEFVVGYGLDYEEKYRQLPYVGVLKEEIYS